jgi:uncharacterized protein YqjF (DUF2071 family)
MSTHSAAPPERVAVPVMRQRWDSLSFLHWPYDVDVVQRFLPAGLTVEAWDGRAWIGLVPFEMHVGGPAGPHMVRFPETNVRTYVVGPDGRPGIWFFSLDAGSVAAVTAARASWQLPYFWSRMSIRRDGDEVVYTASRRAPGPAKAGHEITVVAGDALSDVGEFEHYLTARFTLWNAVAGKLMRTQADHPPWQLRAATAVECREDLLATAGLPAPEGAPIAHYSDGVDVRIGAPRPARRRDSATGTSGLAAG